jgi:hypothetical protein
MTAPFASIEARINNAAIAHVANVIADFGAKGEVEGIFDNEYADALGVVGGSQPMLKVLSSAVTSVLVGDSVTIKGNLFTVQQRQDDGLGMTRFILEES